MNKEMLEMSREMFEREDYDSSLYYLNKTILIKGNVRESPELSAKIHEQFSLTWSALDNKQQSDFHRNMYLDNIVKLNHNAEKEKEAEEILGKLQWWSIKTTLLSAAIILMILVFIFYRNKYSVDEKTGEKILNRKQYDTLVEELDEQIALLKHKLRTNKEQNINKRTKLFLINTVSPLIARLRKAIELNDKEYAQEILSQIEQYNSLLTEWIRLEQGKLSLKIETFNVNELFEVLERNKKTFSIQGLTLKIENGVEAKVKADKVLTLFMLNTLADNARKATDAGGVITIFAEEKEDYLELSVKDSGKGMTEEQVANIFNHSITNGHGFGLLNCRGIINSYKKVGSMFNCCMISVESKLGEGSRFFFRLPIVRILIVAISILGMLIYGSPAANARATRYTEKIDDYYLRQAADFADSAYYSNIDGKYERALSYIDSVQIYLLQTFSDSILIDNISLDASNEAAIASLALHKWEEYRTYNSIYENIIDRLTRSENEYLSDYCEKQIVFLEQIRFIWRLSNILFFILLFVIIISLRYYWLRRKRLVAYREELGIDDKITFTKQLEYENEALHISNNILTNGLSMIKHETMYYPSRISSLLKDDSSSEEISEIIVFYEQLYNNIALQLSNQKLFTGIKLINKNISNGFYVKTDSDLYDYLNILIKKYLGLKKLDINVQKNGVYTDVVINAGQELDTNCFIPVSKNIPILISRQIMRDTSGHNSRGNGILIDGNKIILRYS